MKDQTRMHLSVGAKRRYLFAGGLSAAIIFMACPVMAETPLGG